MPKNLIGLLLTLCSPAALALTTASVTQESGQRYVLQWQGAEPVDVYVSDSPEAPPEQMRLISLADADETHTEVLPNLVRPYFALVEGDGSVTRVAERLLPLQGASNFRDLGGYPAAGAKTVRWGRLYRSGAMAQITADDYEYLSALDIRVLCDLRSREERELVPTDWQAQPAARYEAIDYPAAVILDRISTGTGKDIDSKAVGTLYTDFPEMLKPQYAQMFKALLADEAPLTMNCSAGQDRTGLAAALILSALGTPREVIYQDYHLSTRYRRPENEKGPADYAALADENVWAKFVSERMAKSGDAKIAFAPKPLFDAQGQPRLAEAFRAIEAQYGSVEGYLETALGVDAEGVKRLRSLYTE